MSFAVIVASSFVAPRGVLEMSSAVRKSLPRVVRLFVVIALVAVGTAACTQDESQQPAFDPARDVLFTGNRDSAVPTTVAGPATTEVQTEVTYHFGSTTTTAAPSATSTTLSSSTLAGALASATTTTAP